MMCILGRCAFAEGSVFLRPLKIRCRTCRAIIRGKQVPWGPWRFVPWNPTEESIKESNDLYLTDKEKQDA